MNSNDPDALRLVAQDEADMDVVSALLQDAIIAGADLHFDQQNACFLMVVNRFCWERPALAGVKNSAGGVVHERALCGVRISHVTQVQRHRWPADWRDAFFNILALKTVPVPQQSSAETAIEVSFSGGPSLRLLAKQIDIVLVDLDSGRPTNLQPRHDLEDLN